MKVSQTAYKQLQPTEFEDLLVLAQGELIAKSHSIAELSVIALRHPVECKGGVLPEGGKGTVVHIYRDGEHYEVEFAEPFHCTVTLQRDTSIPNEPSSKGRKRDPGRSEDHPISAEYRSSDRGIQIGLNSKARC